MNAFKKERQHLEATATKLVSLALQAGADSAEVCATFGQKTKILLEKQDFHMASSDDGYQFGLRVLKGDKQGFASCNTTELKDLKEVSSKAVAIAGFSPSNAHWSIVSSENIPTDAPSEMWDDSLHNLSLQTQKDWTKLMVDEALKDPRFRLNDGSLTLSSGLYLILNSQGTHKLERETAASWGLMGMGVEGDNITSFDYFGEISRKSAGLQERLVATTKKFRNAVLQGLKNGPAQSYKGLVVFSPRAVVDILLSPLSYHLNGRMVVEKTSKWNFGDIGKALLSPDITITDSPWLTDRSGCSVFDREGTPTRPKTMFEKGTLKGFFLDHYAAKALGQTPTGHAAGGPSAPPAVSPHCMVIAPGEESWSTILRRLTSAKPEFLYLNRFSGQVDPVTGDFSGVAKGGEWWRNGERVYTVKETLISGNIFDSFGQGLFGISKETEVVESAEESPTFVVDNVSVTSG